MTATLDYASPSIPKPPKLRLGWSVAVISFCISIFVAKEAIESAFWMTTDPVFMSGRGFGYLESWLWALAGFEVIAAAGWVMCVMFGAGTSLARVGVIAGALTWLGAYVVMM